MGQQESIAQHDGRSAGQRPAWLVPLGISIAAVFLRLYVGHVHPELGGDAPQYTTLAKNLAAGHGYSFAHSAPYLASDIRLPGYPALLAVAFSVSGSHWSVVVLNALLGGITTFLVWLIADGLNLSRTRALWCTWIAAFWLATATFAGTAYSENLSVPAILAFIYFMLIRPPRTRLRLFVIGTALAWLAALTRDELVVFVVIVAIVTAHRAHFKVLATVGLALCFVAGSFAWVARNEVQVHRTEYVDSVQTDAVLVAAVNGGPTHLKKVAFVLLRQPTISPAARAKYQHQVYTYVEHKLSHNPTGVAENKVKYGLQSLFPVPIFGLTYRGQSKELIRTLWSLLLVAEYLLALVTTVRWWKSDRRKDVVSVLLYPVFMFIFEMIFDPQYRFILPVNLLLLPLAVEAVAGLFAGRRNRDPGAGQTPTAGEGTAKAADLLGTPN